MSKVLILAAMAAVSLACHNRAEDEVGAAPDQGDTTAVTHAIDSARTGPPGVGGRPGNATVTPDSVGADSALTNQEDPGTPGQTNTDTTATWSSTPQDTLGPRNPNQPAYPQGDTTAADTGVQDTSSMQPNETMQQDDSMQHGDSTMMHGDSTMMHGDSALTEHEVPDTTTGR
jgi:hypothetical protein